MGSRLPDFHVESERSETGGYTVFVVVDEYGDYVEPTRVHNTWAAAREACDRLTREALDNYDGPDDDPTEGAGYCANH